MGSRSFLVWAVGAGVYLLAVFHRTSLGVAGPQAQQRFAISPAQLATFVTLQLALYALMQVPAGVLVDRFGPRRVLLASTLTLGIAQICFALVPNYPLALLARGVLGCGDALAYLSVLRLAAGWFPAKRYSMLTALTGLFGVTGNVIATLPMTALLRDYGWTPTFLVAGGLSVAYAALLLKPAAAAPYQGANAVVTAQAAGRGSVGVPEQRRRVLLEVRRAWREPGGRLGFWVHFSTMSGPTTFGVLWGFPYLSQGLGLSSSTSSSLVLVLVVGQLIGSLTVGTLIGRRPSIRTPLAFGVTITCLVSWLTLILWPGGHPPVPVLVVVILALACGGPASMVAFMLARDYNPRHRISTATGLVNTGGFIAIVIEVLAVGLILDIVEPGAAQPSATAFRWAFSAVALLTAWGLFRLTVWWIRVRAAVFAAQAAGKPMPFAMRRHRFDLVQEATAVAEASGDSSAPDVAQ
ncbi:MFS transporter [Nakamurella antarctica]|uniref:MFS transporter n=2 Tax=Nakamurella antarctica TaxID=1902245 RepID=A0A3G8ZQF9_9ACTN|nr:MFS transporter [Nakamurella antarctica]